MQQLTRERLPRFQFGHTKKEKNRKKKIQKKGKFKKKKIQKNRKGKIQKNRKGKSKKKKEFFFSSLGQNMRLLSLSYS